MKVRTDFVTNSSSSSYIIAFKDDCGFDKETMEKYPFLSIFPNVIRQVLLYDDRWSDTEAAEVYDCIEEYEEKLINEWGYDRKNLRMRSIEEVLKDFSWMRDDYDLIADYLRKGYSVAEKSVSYHEDLIRDEIAVLSRDNPNFIVLRCDD